MTRLLQILLFSLLLTAPASFGVVLFQSDPFSSPSLGGWNSGNRIGMPAPVVIAGGGPAGAGDGYLAIFASSFHLAMRNQEQWSGNYETAGVTGVEIDILGDPVLTGSLRIYLFGPGGTWSNLDPVIVPAGSGWDRYHFDLTATALVLVPAGSGQLDPGAGTGMLGDTLASVQTVLFRHNTTPTPSQTGSHADHVTASFGFDNITAVPEPEVAFLSLLAIGTLLIRRRPRRSRSQRRRVVSGPSARRPATAHRHHRRSKRPQDSKVIVAGVSVPPC